MRDTIRFTLNGEPQDVRVPDPTLTLLDWLRTQKRLTGTKEGCAEGDCGACTVTVIGPAGKVRAINSCIQFLPMIDGCAVTTVEGLLDNGKLHPIQQALVEENGSQCGFCTPGFVMALHAHQSKGGAADTASVCDAIAGNLCRCTGYGPIIRAGQKSAATPPAKPKRLKSSAKDADKPLGYTHEGANGERSFYAPETLDKLAKLCAKHPDATILAGATDVGLWVTKQGRDLPALISVMRVEELQEITRQDGDLVLGAAVRYADAHKALAKLHPSLNDYIRRLGAAQVRDSGTVVGNIANGSPIGDMPPALIALGARIRLRKGEKQRELPLENFFLAYGKQDRKPGEIVTHVVIPPPPKGAFFTAEKISKRFEQDISAVSAGFCVEVKKGQVASARIAFGGMAGIPKRAAAAEVALTGKSWSRDTIDAAASALAQDFQPLTDWRGSAEYRLRSAQSLLLRFFLENSGSPEPTRVGALGGISHG